MNDQPLLVVLTPVRNEAWVLRAFLTATSIWADIIIVADQMSTDGSREIYAEFPKVRVVDNKQEKMYMSETRKLLFNEAAKIEGDKIIFALDADEFLSGDFMHTKAWERILHSKPNDCFCWSWMNLKGNNVQKYSIHEKYFWAVHVSDTSWNGIFPDRIIHEWRLPWPKEADENHTIYIDDFFSIHFARVNQLRQMNKERFYKVSSMHVKDRYTKVSIIRQYRPEHLTYYDIPSDAYCTYQEKGIDIWDLVDLKDEGNYYTDEIIKCFNENGTNYYSWLDIWDKDWCERNYIDNPQKWYHRLFISYMKKTMPCCKSIWVKFIDKFLKILLK